MSTQSQHPAQNTDRELWREPHPDPPGSYYANSIHVTAQGGIGINVGGTVRVLTLAQWHALIAENERLERELAEARREYDSAIRMHDACHEEEDRKKSDDGPTEAA